LSYFSNSDARPHSTCADPARPSGNEDKSMSQSEASKTCVDRQTLYEELWQIPGTQLARKYGISDVALGKACRRHDIPRPPSGFWTMRKHGYEAERTPLPPISDPKTQPS
jgi:hypothetical protein